MSTDLLAASDLVHLIATHDGRSPINELGQLALDGSRSAECWVVSREGTTAGFVILDEREHTVQLGVHPTFRRRGLGTELAQQALRTGQAHTFWAFGDLPGAQALANKLNLVKTRELFQMARPLDQTNPISPPAGVELRSYTPLDAEAIVEVNAAAFASHPEQGNLTLADFTTLTSQSWFDPAGLIVGIRNGEIVGFHWTKRHNAATGEVYVLAVRPDSEGGGLGRALLEAGLAHLSSLGINTVTLYVEATSRRVVAMYQAAGFAITATDASYTRKDAK